MAVRDLIIRIGGDSQELRQALDVGGKALKAFAVAGAAAAAATGAAVVALVADTLKLVEVAKEIQTTARVAGASAEEFQAVAGVLASIHIEGFDVANTFNEIKVKAGDAAAGTIPLQRAFADFGIKAEEFTNLPISEQLARLAEGFVGIEDPTQRLYDLNMLLSDAGKKMIPILEQGGDAVRGMMDEVKSAGVLTDRFAAASVVLTKEIGLFERTAQSARGTLEEELVPAITGTTKAIQVLLANARDTGELETLGETLSRLYLEQVVPAIATVMALVEEFFSLLGTVGPAITLLQSLSNVFTDFNRSLVDPSAWGDLKDSVGEALGALEDFGRSIYGLGDGFERAQERAQTFVDTVWEGVGAARAATGGSGGGWEGKSGLTVVAAPAATAAAPAESDPLAMVGSSMAASKEALASVSALAMEQGAAMHAGLREQFEALVDAAAAAAQALKDTVLSVADSVGSIFGSVAQVAQEGMNAATARYQEYASEIASIDDQIANSEDANEKRRLKAKRDALKKKADAEKKSAKDAFKINKAAALMQAGVSAALAIINAAATVPFVPAGIIAMIAAGAAGAVQIGIIAAQQPPAFHSGGIVGRGLAAQNADLARGVNINALPGEGVVTRRGMDALERINRGEAGGSGSMVVNTYWEQRMLSHVVQGAQRDAAPGFRTLGAPPAGRVNLYAPRP